MKKNEKTNNEITENKVNLSVEENVARKEAEIAAKAEALKANHVHKELNTAGIISVLLALISGFFAYVGVYKHGFWDKVNGPMPGFFPTIMALVMLFGSIVALIASLRKKEKAVYFLEELYIIGAVLLIIIATYLIGLVPSIFIFLLLWMRVFEKETWKTTIIVMLVAAFIVLGIFGYWLEIRFPWGIFANFF